MNIGNKTKGVILMLAGVAVLATLFLGSGISSERNPESDAATPSSTSSLHADNPELSPSTAQIDGVVEEVLYTDDELSTLMLSVDEVHGYGPATPPIAVQENLEITLRSAAEVSHLQTGQRVSVIVSNQQEVGGGSSENWSLVELSELPTDKKELADSCRQSGGSWLAEHNECEYTSAQWCRQQGGSFDACTSACRHDPEAELCTTQCVPVCRF